MESVINVDGSIYGPIHRGGAEDGEETQRKTETLVIPLRFLSVLRASAVNGLYLLRLLRSLNPLITNKFNVHSLHFIAATDVTAGLPDSPHSYLDRL
jgi:hypothetical protein